MDPNISPSGQQPDDQSQTATATAEPPQQQQPQAQQVAGPFSAYLDPSQTREPTHTASQQRPSGFMGPAGKMAFFADQFLAGVAKGRANAYNRSIQQQAVTYKRLDQAAQDIQSNPTLTDEDKQGLLNKLYQFKASAVAGATDPNAGQGEGGKKKGKKQDGQDQQNPVIKFIHEAATRLAGPGAQPQQITPQSVNQVLGEVYSGMSQKVGAKQQLEAANKEYMAAAAEAIDAVPEGKEITTADIWKNERYQKAHAKLAGLSPKGQIPPDLTKPLDEMLKRKSAKPYEAELPDGSKVPVTVDADGVVRDSSGTVMPGGSYKQLFRPGTEAAPKTPPEDKKVTESRDRIKALLKLKPEDKLSADDENVAKALAGDDDNIKTRFQANVMGGMSPRKAYESAVKAQAKKLDAAEKGIDLGNVLKDLGIVKKGLDIDNEKKKIASVDDKGAKREALRAINGVHAAKPEDQAEFDKLVSQIQNNSTDSAQARAAAQTMVNRAISNVSDFNNYTMWSDEVRTKVINQLKSVSSSEVAKSYHEIQEPAATAPPPGGEKGAAAKAQAKQGRTPPGGGGPPVQKFSEAQVREWAKANGVDPDKAVATAKQRNGLQ